MKKQCSNCRKLKPRSAFNKATGLKDGLQGWCKLCKRDYYKHNQEKIKAQTAKRRRDNPNYMVEWRKNNKDKIRKSKMDWCANNRDKLRLHCLAYSKSHPEKIKQLGIAWRKANVDRVRDYCSQRRARERNAVVELVQRTTVFKRDRGICHICNKKVSSTNWHLDHIIPLSRGGKHSYENVAVSHPKCNLVKSAS